MIYPSVGRDQNSPLGEISQLTMGGQTLERYGLAAFPPSDAEHTLRLVEHTLPP